MKTKELSVDYSTGLITEIPAGQEIAGVSFQLSKMLTKTELGGYPCLIFGANDTGKMEVRLSDGVVLFGDNEDVQFVNSSFDLFLQCLGKHQELTGRVFSDDDDENCFQMGKHLESFISQTDNPAPDTNCFWAMIIEELVIGYIPYAPAPGV